MHSQVTSNVKVQVETKFVEHSSEMRNNRFLFAYSIFIKNDNRFSIQLLSRHWKIQDSLAPISYVSGEGVVGECPILLPGESYQYQSYCELKSSIGCMEGTYIFRKEEGHELMEIEIPKFHMMHPAKMN